MTSVNFCLTMASPEFFSWEESHKWRDSTVRKVRINDDNRKRFLDKKLIKELERFLSVKSRRKYKMLFSSEKIIQRIQNSLIPDFSFLDSIHAMSNLVIVFRVVFSPLNSLTFSCLLFLFYCTSVHAFSHDSSWIILLIFNISITFPLHLLLISYLFNGCYFIMSHFIVIMGKMFMWKLVKLFHVQINILHLGFLSKCGT